MIPIIIFICQEIRAQVFQEYIGITRLLEIVLLLCELRWNLNFIWLSQRSQLANLTIL